MRGTYDKAEIRNVISRLKKYIKKPAKAGPITREALNDAEFKPIALPRSFFSTSIETNTNLTGWYIALSKPCKSDKEANV